MPTDHWSQSAAAAEIQTTRHHHVQLVQSYQLQQHRGTETDGASSENSLHRTTHESFSCSTPLLSASAHSDSDSAGGSTSGTTNDIGVVDHVEDARLSKRSGRQHVEGAGGGSSADVCGVTSAADITIAASARRGRLVCDAVCARHRCSLLALSPLLLLSVLCILHSVASVAPGSLFAQLSPLSRSWQTATTVTVPGTAESDALQLPCLDKLSHVLHAVLNGSSNVSTSDFTSVAGPLIASAYTFSVLSFDSASAHAVTVRIRLLGRLCRRSDHVNLFPAAFFRVTALSDRQVLASQPPVLLQPATWHWSSISNAAADTRVGRRQRQQQPYTDAVLWLADRGRYNITVWLQLFGAAADVIDMDGTEHPPWVNDYAGHGFHVAVQPHSVTVDIQSDERNDTTGLPLCGLLQQFGSDRLYSHAPSHTASVGEITGRWQLAQSGQPLKYVPHDCQLNRSVSLMSELMRLRWLNIVGDSNYRSLYNTICRMAHGTTYTGYNQSIFGYYNQPLLCLSPSNLTTGAHEGDEWIVTYMNWYLGWEDVLDAEGNVNFIRECTHYKRWLASNTTERANRRKFPQARGFPGCERLRADSPLYSILSRARGPSASVMGWGSHQPGLGAAKSEHVLRSTDAYGQRFFRYMPTLFALTTNCRTDVIPDKFGKQAIIRNNERIHAFNQLIARVVHDMHQHHSMYFDYPGMDSNPFSALLDVFSMTDSAAELLHTDAMHFTDAFYEEEVAVMLHYLHHLPQFTLQLPIEQWTAHGGAAVVLAPTPAAAARAVGAPTPSSNLTSVRAYFACRPIVDGRQHAPFTFVPMPLLPHHQRYMYDRKQQHVVAVELALFELDVDMVAGTIRVPLFERLTLVDGQALLQPVRGGTVQYLHVRSVTAELQCRVLHGDERQREGVAAEDGGQWQQAAIGDTYLKWSWLTCHFDRNKGPPTTLLLRDQLNASLATTTTDGDPPIKPARITAIDVCRYTLPHVFAAGFIKSMWGASLRNQHWVFDYIAYGVRLGIDFYLVFDRTAEQLLYKQYEPLIHRQLVHYLYFPAEHGDPRKMDSFIDQAVQLCVFHIWASKIAMWAYPADFDELLVLPSRSPYAPRACFGVLCSSPLQSVLTSAAYSRYASISIQTFNILQWDVPGHVLALHPEDKFRRSNESEEFHRSLAYSGQRNSSSYLPYAARQLYRSSIPPMDTAHKYIYRTDRVDYIEVHNGRSRQFDVLELVWDSASVHDLLILHYRHLTGVRGVQLEHEHSTRFWNNYTRDTSVADTVLTTPLPANIADLFMLYPTDP